MVPDRALAQAFEATWPAAEYRDAGGFRIGRGPGGGGRVSSARALEGWNPEGLAEAAQVHRDWGQRALFRAPEADLRLTGALADAGYRRHDPVMVMETPAAALNDRGIPPLAAIPSWPPLAIQREIWAAGQFGPGHLAVMARVSLPRMSILGRIDDRSAGTLFLAIDGPVAMVHAVVIRPGVRRQGVAGWLIRAAAMQAQRAGAERLALAVALDNDPAIALYRKLGFTESGRYAYWV